MAGKYGQIAPESTNALTPSGWWRILKNWMRKHFNSATHIIACFVIFEPLELLLRSSDILTPDSSIQHPVSRIL